MGPAMHLCPQIQFDNQFHEHVICVENEIGFSICNDMLTNYKWFFNASREKVVATGWTSGCTLRSLLL